ncbi:MAG: DUF192 domain-containing protein [Ilumatobacter sp.]
MAPPAARPPVVTPRWLGALGLASAIVLGCATSESLDGSSTAVSSTDVPSTWPTGFESSTVEVAGADGSMRESCMWIADTPERRARGMMEVTGFGVAEAMVFVQETPVSGQFWMKNTVIPLSIAYFDAFGEYLGAHDMTPCTTPECERYPTAAGYRWAVEAPLGGLAALGIGEGSTLRVTDRPCSG